MHEPLHIEIERFPPTAVALYGVDRYVTDRSIKISWDFLRRTVEDGIPASDACVALEYAAVHLQQCSNSSFRWSSNKAMTWGASRTSPNTHSFLLFPE